MLDLGVLNLAHENQMIAARIDIYGFTLHNGERILYKGHSKPSFKVKAGRPFGLSLGKHSRKIFLVFGEHTDAEPL